MRIIVVDDDRISSILFKVAFAGSAETVHADSISAAAAELSGGGTFDVVVSDHKLPDGDSSDVLRAAKAANPDILSVLTSAVDDASFEEIGRGFDLSFQKPVSILDVRRGIIAAHLARTSLRGGGLGVRAPINTMKDDTGRGLS